MFFGGKRNRKRGIDRRKRKERRKEEEEDPIGGFLWGSEADVKSNVLRECTTFWVIEHQLSGFYMTFNGETIFLPQLLTASINQLKSACKLQDTTPKVDI